MATDAALLQRYASSRDADAFAELVSRYAQAVYGTCLRITGNVHDAEDVAQESLLELARNAGMISSSLPGWLHTIASRRALNAVRDAATRRNHEKQVMLRDEGSTEPSWAEIAPHVDEALEQLPEELRVPLLLGYLNERSQGQIAEHLGVSQSTISRRIEKGIDELRGKLKKAGVIVSVAALSALLAENAATAAPPTLTAALGKMALAGVGESGASAAAGGATAAGAGAGASLGSKLGVAAAAVLIAGLAVVGYITLRDNEPEPPAPVVAAQQVKPASGGRRPAMTERAKEVLKGQKCGLRYDPMKWLKNDTSVQAARARTFIFGQPAPSDRAVLEREIDSILATQQPDGSLARPGAPPLWVMRNTAGKIIRLHQFGCRMDRPDVQRAGRRMLAAAKELGRLDCCGLPAACLLGTTDPEIIRTAAELEAKTLLAADPRAGDGTGPKLRVLALWAARHVTDHADAIEHGLRVMREGILEGAGWPVWCAPWGHLECAGTVDHPLAREIAVAQLPMLLRAQYPDGGWGESGYDRPDPTYLALAALHRWGLLAPLSERPALPQDWRVLQTVGLPHDIGDVQSMTWADGCIWLWSRERSEATAIAIPDGTVLKRHKLSPTYYAIAWHDEALLLSSNGPPSLTWIDPETGTTKRRVDCKLPHPWCTLWVVAVVDGRPVITTPSTPRYLVPTLCGSPSIVDMAGAGRSIWHVDTQAMAIIRSAVDDGPKLLDWGERPFGDGTTAIAHDGTHLWVLDNRGKRICKIEKAGAASGKHDTRR